MELDQIVSNGRLPGRKVCVYYIYGITLIFKKNVHIIISILLAVNIGCRHITSLNNNQYKS